MPASFQYLPNGHAWRVFVRADFRTFSFTDSYHHRRVSVNIVKGGLRSHALGATRDQHLDGRFPSRSVAVDALRHRFQLLTCNATIENP
jgi:hypothetical protein